MPEFVKAPRLKARLHVLGIAAVMLLIGILFYALNFYTPMFADDYSYSFSFLTRERIESVFQIVSSQVGHYQIMNGRSVTHFLAQLFLMAGDRAFNYFNTFFFLILLVLAYLHACGSLREFSLAKFSMAVMLVFLSCPAFGQSFLWITGAANYLYGILIVLAFLLPYRLQKNGASPGVHPFREMAAATVYLLLGVVAGWTNENTSVAMIVMIAGYIVYYRLNAITIHAWNITGGIGGVIGCVLVLSSPGTAMRLEAAGGSGGIISWLKRMVFYSCDMMVYLRLPILLFAVLLCLYLHQKQGVLAGGGFMGLRTFLEECGVTPIYALGFLASIYSMIVSPQFPGRAWSGPVILFVITLIGFCSRVDSSEYTAAVGKRIALGFMVLLCAATYINAYFELKNVDAGYRDRISAIETAIASGERSVEVPSIYGWTGYSCYGAGGDLSADSSEWPNTSIARYYGIDEIVRSD